MGLDSHRIDRDDQFLTNKKISYPACNLLKSRRHYVVPSAMSLCNTFPV